MLDQGVELLDKNPILLLDVGRDSPPLDGQLFAAVHISLFIELYIRTRGRTRDAACTNATGPQGGTRAILYAR